MPKPRLYYIRHGQTDWNAELRFQGRQDIALNATGRAQALQNGLKLAGLIANPQDYDFVTSPLGRTRETMEIVRKAMGLDPGGYRIDDRLIEASYGLLEGTTLHEFKAADPASHKQRKRERWNFCPPQGESHAMVHRRIREWYETVNADTIVVGHGVVGRVLRYHLLGLDPDEAAEYIFPQDRVFVWDGTGEKLF
ncbi:MAG: histidine phosphatase family protein [Nitratireductor sp.]|nr:histidine phosphatase family protein [Nitratireductor sp.]